MTPTQRLAARYILSKVEPLKLLGVKTSFETIDEWHDTTVTLTLQSKTKGPSEAVVRAWLTENWSSIHSKVPSKTPPPAQEPEWDEENEDSGDAPKPGLGWVNPQFISLRNAEDTNFEINNNIVIVRLTISTRD